jgi:hypothetical protein
MPLCKIGYRSFIRDKRRILRNLMLYFSMQLYYICKINTDLLHNTYYLLRRVSALIVGIFQGSFFSMCSACCNLYVRNSTCRIRPLSLNSDSEYCVMRKGQKHVFVGSRWHCCCHARFFSSARFDDPQSSGTLRNKHAVGAQRCRKIAIGLYQLWYVQKTY